ncbi:unnamed protein product, partial [Effrenium voratum]
DKRQHRCGSDLLTLHGYQPRGELGQRFNAHRSGFVVNGRRPLPLAAAEVQERMASWRERIWQLAGRIFQGLLLEMEDLQVAPSALGADGERDMVTASQFHIKEMHPCPGTRQLQDVYALPETLAS